MDRISELPVHIIHNIFSILPPHTLAAASTISKAWWRAYISFPELCICSRAISRNARRSRDLHGSLYCIECLVGNIKTKLLPSDCLTCKDRAWVKMYAQMLIELANTTFRRFHNTGLNLQKFTLDMCLLGKEVYKVERWINFAAAYELYELSLSFESREIIVMPSTLLVNGKSLRVLTLTRCKFEDDFLMDTSATTMLPSLQKLSLSIVELSDSVLARLISCCPLVSELRLINCKSIRTLCVDSLSKLKKVHLENTFRSNKFGFQKIVIKSQELDCLCFKNFTCKKECEIDLDSCKASLKELEISCCVLPKSILRETQVSFSNFTRVKILSLYFSQPLLEKIDLSRLDSLEEATTFAPSLSNIKFDNPSTGILSGSFKSPKLQKTTFTFVNIWMTCWIKRIQSLLWALHNETVISLRFPVLDVGKFHNKEFHVNPKLQKCRVVHLKLKFEADFNCKDIVDALFNTCCMQVLTLTWRRTSSDLGEKLFQLGLPLKIDEYYENKTEDLTCCSDSKVHCWRHYVENYKELKGNSCLGELKLQMFFIWPLYSKKRKYIEEATILAGPKIPGQCYVYDCLGLPCLD